LILTLFCVGLGPIKCQASVPTRHPLKSVLSFTSFGGQEALLFGLLLWFIYIKSRQEAWPTRELIVEATSFHKQLH